MRFLFILAVAAFALYAVLTLSLYGSIDPCRALGREIVAESVRQAEQRAIDRGEPGLPLAERKALQARTERGVAARIQARELSYLQCLRLFVTLKREGAAEEEIRPLFPPGP